MGRLLISQQSEGNPRFLSFVSLPLVAVNVKPLKLHVFWRILVS
jgi:hypothetical protein